MADKQKRCPLRWLISGGYSEDCTSPCIREECQWWIPSGEDGCCAIEFAGIALAEQAGYILTAGEQDTKEPEPQEADTQ